MKYEELVAELSAGKTLESLLDLTKGQDCFIYKAKGKCFDLNEVIYIPDVSLNDIPTDYVMSKDDLAEWAIGDGIYRHYNPIEWTATIEELEPGIYGYTSTTVSNIPAENYEMLTVLCNGTYMNIKGHVKIVYDSNAPYIEYKSTNTVNTDSVIIHVQKGQIKNNGVSTITR